MNLLRRANHGGFFHYMDSFNRNAYGDPLLVKSKTKGSIGGYILTAIIAVAVVGVAFLNEGIKHA